MKIFDYIPFNFRQTVKLILIFNNPVWHRHTDVFLLKILLKYNKHNVFSVFRFFFLLRYPKMWHSYAELIGLALEKGNDASVKEALKKLSNDINFRNIKIEDHILMLINIYQIFLFFGMCRRGLEFRTEAREIFHAECTVRNSLANSSHPIRLKGFWLEIASLQYSKENQNQNYQLQIPDEVFVELSKTKLSVTSSLSDNYSKLLRRGVILRGPSQVGQAYKVESDDTLVIMNPKANTKQIVEKIHSDIPIIGFYNGEQYHYLKKKKKMFPKNLDYYCFKNDKYLPTAKRIVGDNKVRSFELCDDWLFNGTSNALQNILFDFAMSSVSNVSICYFDFMLSISRSATHYPKDWGRDNHETLREVIRTSCATSEDPISQFHFAKFIIFEYGFNVDDQLKSAIQMTEEEFAAQHEIVYRRCID